VLADYWKSYHAIGMSHQVRQRCLTEEQRVRACFNDGNANCSCLSFIGLSMTAWPTYRQSPPKLDRLNLGLMESFA
jgi:hypothetical protein